MSHRNSAGEEMHHRKRADGWWGGCRLSEWLILPSYLPESSFGTLSQLSALMQHGPTVLGLASSLRAPTRS